MGSAIDSNNIARIRDTPHNAAMQFLENIERSLDQAERIIVGYSAGMDSSVLLHRLASEPTWRSKIVAVHINHGVHAQSDDWAAHAQAGAKKLGCAYYHHRLDPLESRANLESVLRTQRRQFLQSFANEQDVIALAHHAQDQLETVIYRLQRGAGLKGLGAMKAKSDFGSSIMLRPLLHQPKAVLTKYARKHKIDYIEDPSNRDMSFDRNYIRHTIIPPLRTRFTGIEERVEINTRILQQEQILLASLFRHALSSCLVSKNSLGCRLSKESLSSLLKQIDLPTCARPADHLNWSVFAKSFIEWLRHLKPNHVSDTLAEHEIKTLATFLSNVFQKDQPSAPASCELDNVGVYIELSGDAFYLFFSLKPVFVVHGAITLPALSLLPKRSREWFQTYGIDKALPQNSEDCGSVIYEPKLKVPTGNGLRSARKYFQSLQIPNSMRRQITFSRLPNGETSFHPYVCNQTQRES